MQCVPCLSRMKYGLYESHQTLVRWELLWAFARKEMK